MSEQWREELQQYAYLLKAVAKGDRSMVVKILADYLLANREGHANDSFEDTTLPDWEHISSLQRHYDDTGESDDITVPQKSVRFADVYYDNADEEQEEGDGQQYPYNAESYGYNDYQDRLDGIPDLYNTDYGNQNYDEGAAWDDPYTFGASEEEPNQSTVDESTVYDDPYRSQEGSNLQPYEVEHLAPDSRYHYTPNFYGNGHTPSHFRSEMAEYNLYYNEYHEDGTSPDYTSGQFANEDF